MSFESGYVAGASNIDEQDLQETTLPIFNVERVSLQFNVASDFVAAQVANNVLILALANGRILRIDLERPGDIDGMHLMLVSQMIPMKTNLTDTIRYRSTKASTRNWYHSASLPRSFSLASPHHDYRPRHILPTYAITNPETLSTAEGRCNLSCSMEPCPTHCEHTRDTSGRCRWQCL